MFTSICTYFENCWGWIFYPDFHYKKIKELSTHTEPVSPDNFIIEIKKNKDDCIEDDYIFADIE